MHTASIFPDSQVLPISASQKDCPPLLDDEVCRLKKIQKGGAFHEKLKANRIVTVQDFLRAKVMDANELRTVRELHA